MTRLRRPAFSFTFLHNFELGLCAKFAVWAAIVAKFKCSVFHHTLSFRTEQNQVVVETQTVCFSHPRLFIIIIFLCGEKTSPRTMQWGKHTFPHFLFSSFGCCHFHAVLSSIYEPDNAQNRRAPCDRRVFFSLPLSRHFLSAHTLCVRNRSRIVRKMTF